MNVLVKRERMKLGGDGLKLGRNVLLSPLVIVVDVEDGGQATFVSKSSIGFKGQVHRSGRGCIRISLLKERKEQGKRVALAIVKLVMHKYILSRATFVAGVIGQSIRVMELVDGFGAGVLQALASSPNKVAFINNHHSNVRVMVARNGKITSRSRSRDVIETKPNRNDDSTRLGRLEANGTRLLGSVGLIVMEDISAMGNRGTCTSVKLNTVVDRGLGSGRSTMGWTEVHKCLVQSQQGQAWRNQIQHQQKGPKDEAQCQES